MPSWLTRARAHVARLICPEVFALCDEMIAKAADPRVIVAVPVYVKPGANIDPFEGPPKAQDDTVN